MSELKPTKDKIVNAVRAALDNAKLDAVVTTAIENAFAEMDRRDNGAVVSVGPLPTSYECSVCHKPWPVELGRFDDRATDGRGISCPLEDDGAGNGQPVASGRPVCCPGGQAVASQVALAKCNTCSWVGPADGSQIEHSKTHEAGTATGVSSGVPSICTHCGRVKEAEMPMCSFCFIDCYGRLPCRRCGGVKTSEPCPTDRDGLHDWPNLREASITVEDLKAEVEEKSAAFLLKTQIVERDMRKADQLRSDINKLSEFAAEQVAKEKMAEIEVAAVKEAREAEDREIARLARDMVWSEARGNGVQAFECHRQLRDMIVVRPDAE